MSSTLLSQIRTLLTVDVDSMDPTVAIRNTTATESFCDMTSNQAIVYSEAIRPERAHLVRSAIQYVNAKGLDKGNGEFLQDVIDILTVLLAKDVYPSLTGNVHAQTSPSAAYNTEKTVEHAKKLVTLFEQNGIPRERVCIKIPATPESIIACQLLGKMGIQTLATCLFSVPQAIAASQAGCRYVAPYFNELRVHFEPTLWREYKETAEEHPMCSVIHSIVVAFQKLGSKTLIMPASIVTVNEVIALVSLGPDHLTLSSTILDQMAAMPAISLESRTLYKGSVTVDAKGKDYLLNNAKLLKDALASDAEVLRKLEDALKIFHQREQMTKEFIHSFVV